MLNQISTLTKLQFCNLYGKNVFRYTKDKKVKFKGICMLFIFGLLIIMLAGYIGGTVYGYAMLGLVDIVPAYLILVSSALVFIFSFFKAGGIIFQKKAYDIISSLPVSQTAIVISRFIRIYVEEFVLNLVVMVSGLGVYAYITKPDVSFYIISVAVIFAVPLLPITVATLIGAAVMGIASRIKHKGIISALLSISIVCVYLFGVSKLTNAEIEDELSAETLEKLADFIAPMIGKIYPPAVELGNAMLNGDYLACAFVIGVFLAIFSAMAALVSAAFHSICRRLFSASAKHDYKMQQLKGSSVMAALYKKELKRYLSSGVYITNTIVTPLMGLCVAIAVSFMDMSFLDALPFKVDVIGLLPFVLGAVFSLIPTTCTSVSLEGKEWWIYKSLPVRAKEIFGSKILLNISLAAPFYVAAEAVLAIALKPDFIQMLWLVAIPAICIVFDSVFGITVNLMFPVFNWENETAIVKQSVSSGLGMLGFIVPAICAVPVALITQFPSDLIKLAVCVILILITAGLNEINNSKDLKSIG